MKVCSVLVSLAVLLLTVTILCAPALGQSAIISITRSSCQFRYDTLLAGGNPRFVLTYSNQTGEKVDICNGFKISSPDGAVWDSVTFDTVNYAINGESPFAAYFGIVFALMRFEGNGVDTVGVLGTGRPTRPTSQLPSGYSDTSLALTIWNLSYANVGKHVCIDTSFFQPGGTWTWIGSSLNQYYPTFVGLPGVAYSNGQPGTRLGSGYCFYIYDLPSCASRGGSGRPLSPSEAAACESCFPCCLGKRGNVNADGIIDLADLASLENYLTASGYVLPCPDAANVNGSGLVDLADLSALISYLCRKGYNPPLCP